MRDSEGKKPAEPRSSGQKSPSRAFPRFEPHPLIRGPHAQTIAGVYLPGPRIQLPWVGHTISLDDGDRLSLLDTAPQGWGPGDPAALLIHGLAGDADSPYILRMAQRLSRLGVRAVRVNLRGAGLGFGLARQIYHAGRSDDLRRAVEWLAEQVPGSPIAVVGYSLGAALTLKLAAEAAIAPLPPLDCVVAANPPLDLSACARHIRRPENRLYDRHFVKNLRLEVNRLHDRFPELGPARLERVQSLYEFDDRYTAKRGGFASAEDYYARSSAKGRVGTITLPGLVVHAADDPFIPLEAFLEVDFPSNLEFELVPRGGHLGYLSRKCWGPDRRWLDARIAAWFTERWALIG